MIKEVFFYIEEIEAIVNKHKVILSQVKDLKNDIILKLRGRNSVMHESRSDKSLKINLRQNKSLVKITQSLVKQTNNSINLILY